MAKTAAEALLVMKLAKLAKGPATNPPISKPILVIVAASFSSFSAFVSVTVFIDENLRRPSSTTALANACLRSKFVRDDAALPV